MTHNMFVFTGLSPVFLTGRGCCGCWAGGTGGMKLRCSWWGNRFWVWFGFSALFLLLVLLLVFVFVLLFFVCFGCSRSPKSHDPNASHESQTLNLQKPLRSVFLDRPNKTISVGCHRWRPNENITKAPQRWYLWPYSTPNLLLVGIGCAEAGEQLLCSCGTGGQSRLVDEARKNLGLLTFGVIF